VVVVIAFSLEVGLDEGQRWRRWTPVRDLGRQRSQPLAGHGSAPRTRVRSGLTRLMATTRPAAQRRVRPFWRRPTHGRL